MQHELIRTEIFSLFDPIQVRTEYIIFAINMIYVYFFEEKFFLYHNQEFVFTDSLNESEMGEISNTSSVACITNEEHDQGQSLGKFR